MPRRKYWKKGVAAKQRCNLKADVSGRENLENEECYLNKKCTEECDLNNKRTEECDLNNKRTEECDLNNKRTEECDLNNKSTEECDLNNKRTNDSDKLLDCCQSSENPSEIVTGKHNTMKQSSRGNFNQGDIQFGYYRGTQCVANSFVSIVFNTIKGAFYWEGDDLDHLLLAGNRLYENVMTSTNITNRLLLISELPSRVELFGNVYTSRTGESYMGVMSDDISEDLTDIIFSMRESINKSLSEFNSCFITFADSTVSVIKNNDKYCLFDPHSRDSLGMLVEDGTSVLIRYNGIEDIYLHCLRLLSSMGKSRNTEFEVTGMNVIVLNEKPNDIKSNISHIDQLERSKHRVSQSIGENHRAVASMPKTYVECGDEENTQVTTGNINHKNSDNPDIICVASKQKKYVYNPLLRTMCTNLCEKLGIRNVGRLDSVSYISEANNGVELGDPCVTKSIKMDGNCFFRALSYSISGTEDNHRKLRLAIVKHMQGDVDKFVPFLRSGHRSIPDYIQKSRMRYLNSWATELEIVAACDLLEVDIFTFSTRWLRYSRKMVNANCNKSEYAVYLKHCGECHYEVVTCVKPNLKHKQSITDHCLSTQQSSRRKRMHEGCSGVSAKRRKGVNGKRQYREDKRDKMRSIRICSKKTFTTGEERQIVKKVLQKRRYRQDEGYRDSEKRRSVEKYKNNQKHRESVIAYNKQKYANDQEFRDSQIAYNLEKYANDQEFRDSQIAYNVQKYANDQEFRDSQIAYNVEKYANDPHYKEFVKFNSRSKYCNSAEFRDQVKKGNLRRALKKKDTRNKMTNVTMAFRISIREAPDHICSVCNRRLFSKQVIACKKKLYEERGAMPKSVAQKCISDKYLHVCSSNCPELCYFQTSPRSKLWICFTCHRKIISGKLPAEACVNNLHVDPVPDELKCLNSLEQHLISLHIPFSKIINLPKGSQRGIHGPVVCIPSDVNNTVNVLPRNEDDDQLIRVKLKRKISYKGHVDFKFVKKSRVQNALKVLGEINKWYSDVVFNTNWVNPHSSLQSHNDTESVKVSDLMDKNEDDSEETVVNDTGMYMDSCLQPVDIGQEVLDQHFDNIFCVAPGEGNRPVKILMDESNEAKSFPALFPTGSPTYHDDREERITLARYLHTRLMLADSRFARNTEYIFYAQYLSEVSQVLSSVSIALRKGFSNLSGERFTADKLINRDCLSETLRRDDGYKFLKPIRGTPSFWQSVQKDLFAMLRQLGIPTWFCSFSSGDTRWKEIIEAILREDGDTREAEELDWCEKCSVLRQNPVTAARMFDSRFHSFLKEVIMSPAQPIGKIVDYFYRIEFQQRGSPHTHCLFWVEGAPKFDKNSDESVAEFVEQYISCDMPPSSDPDLYEIVSSVQVHSKRHSNSCRKKGTTCRFNFPRPPSAHTFVSRVVEEQTQKPDENNSEISQGVPKAFSKDDAKEILSKLWKALEKPDGDFESVYDLFEDIGISQDVFESACNVLTTKSKVILKRNAKDVWVNQYNPELLRCWNANMDIQFVIDAYSCIVYIISYISKAEREMGILLDHAQKEARDGNKNAKEAMKKVGSVYLHNREVSAQEAVFRVCNLRLKECSRKVQFIPTGENPVRMSKPIARLQEISNGDDLNDDSMWMTNTYDRYKSRPQEEKFNELCLASFCSEYRILYKSERSDAQSSQKRNPSHKLQHNLGYIKRRSRTKPAVIRYARFSAYKDPEKYYHGILQLYLPHETESQLKPQQFETFKDFYDTGSVKCGKNKVEFVKDIVNRNKANFESDVEKLEMAEKILESGVLLEDAWAQICPETEVERLSTLENRKDINRDPQEDTDIPDLINKDKKQHAVEVRQSIPTRDEAQNLMKSLNKKQREIFYKVREWCLQKTSVNKPKPFHVFVTGGAGTGKSHLIKCIQYEASRILAPTLPNPDEISVVLTAPTGIAAFNINASTIHSTFCISIDAKLPYQPLGDEKINSLRAKFGNLQLLIIDEISMVDHKLLTYIHGRLRQIKQCRDFSPFGKVSVIAVGDFYQLPPVKGKPLYTDNGGVNLWAELFHIEQLAEIMRQKDQAFARMLNRLRKHRKSDTLEIVDINTLRQCETGEEGDALHICATNGEVESHNMRQLMLFCSNHVTIEAEDFYKDAKTGKLEKRESQYIRVFNTNLPRKLTLAVNARVMLTKNIDVSDGLVNGVFGFVSYIQQTAQFPFPEVVYVVFDNEKVGKSLREKTKIPEDLPPNSCPIFAQEDRVTNSGGIRRQFPLKLAFACTIHKIQGSTLHKVNVSMEKIFSAGQAYVALSRVTSLKGLVIKNFKESSIYCNDKVATAMEDMPPFISTNRSITQKDVDFKLILHNIQGIKLHLEDIKCDKRFLDRHFICLTETWLTKDDPQGIPELPQFIFIHKPRFECYDNSEKSFADLRQQVHGGVGLYHKEKVHFEILDLKVANMEHLAFSTSDRNITVVVIYRPSSYRMETFRRQLICLLRKLDDFGRGCLVIGDFNENILNYSDVLNVMKEHGFIQYVREPTTEGRTLIDHVYGRGIDSLDVTVIPTYFSYHEAISIEI